MRLPRIHPADRALDAGQALTVLTSGCTTGLLTWAVTTQPELYVSAAFGAAALTLGGQMWARQAGARSARRALNAHLESQRRHQAETADVGGVPPAAVDTDPAARQLTAAGAGKAGVMGRMIAELPDGAAVTVVEGKRATLSPEDEGWLPAVRQVVELLDKVWKPGDGGVEGRGVFELASLVSMGVGGLDEETLVALVGDYVMVRAGKSPTSNRGWHGALDEVTFGDSPIDLGAVRRLAVELLGVIRREDGYGFGGRGIGDLTSMMAAVVPELPIGLVRRFVRDYIHVRDGVRVHANWHRMLGGLAEEHRAAWIIDLVTYTGNDGLDLNALAIRIDRMGGSDEDGLAWVKPLAGRLVRERKLSYDGGRYRGPRMVVGGDGRWQAEPAADPDASQRVRDAQRLAQVLAEEILPEDGNLAGRGKSQLTAAVARLAPELDSATTAAFVADYMEVRAGYRPKSGWSWYGVLEGLGELTQMRLAHDLIASKKRAGVTRGELLRAADWLDPFSVRWVGRAVARLIAAGLVTDSMGRYRAVDQDGGTAG